MPLVLLLPHGGGINKHIVSRFGFPLDLTKKSYFEIKNHCLWSSLLLSAFCFSVGLGITPMEPSGKQKNEVLFVCGSLQPVDRQSKWNQQTPGKEPQKTTGQWSLKYVPYKNVPQRNTQQFMKYIFGKTVLFEREKNTFLKDQWIRKTEHLKIQFLVITSVEYESVKISMRI